MNRNADAAMKQIDLKEYFRRFALCGLPVVKVGVSFNREAKNVGEWKVVKE